MEISDDKERLRKVVVKFTKEEMMDFLKELTGSVQKINLDEYKKCETFLFIKKNPEDPKDFATFKMILSGDSNDTKRD